MPLVLIPFTPSTTPINIQQEHNLKSISTVLESVSQSRNHIVFLLQLAAVCSLSFRKSYYARWFVAAVVVVVVAIVAFAAPHYVQLLKFCVCLCVPHFSNCFAYFIAK